MERENLSRFNGQIEHSQTGGLSELEPSSTPERHQFANSLTFDSVKIRLTSDSKETVDFCADYFESYAQIDNRIIQEYDWTVSEQIDESIKSNSWNVDETNKEIVISGRSFDKRFTMRVLRSLVMLEDISHGKVMFRGSSFVNKNGKGIVLMGEKRAGKTSIILNYMLKNDPQARFVTNSQVALNLEMGKLYAYGYPMSVGVRLKVLESMQKRGNKNISPLIYDLKNNMQPGEENRYYLDPSRLRMYFQNRIANKAQVDAIILVKSIPTRSSSTIRELSIRKVENFFKEYYIRHYNRESGGWYNLFKVDMDKQINSINDLLENCNLYELTYNVGSQIKTLGLIDQI